MTVLRIYLSNLAGWDLAYSYNPSFMQHPFSRTLTDGTFVDWL